MCVCVSTASSTLYHTGKTLMKHNHTAEHMPDDVNMAGVRAAARELQATTPTKRAEDRAVHTEQVHAMVAFRVAHCWIEERQFGCCQLL